MSISKKELIDLVSEQSDYFKYQVEDVLHALAVVVSREIAEGNEVRVEGLGTFKYKPPRKIENFSPWTGRKMDKMTKPSCKFKPDLLLLNLLKQNLEGE